MTNDAVALGESSVNTIYTLVVLTFKFQYGSSSDYPCIDVNICPT